MRKIIEQVFALNVLYPKNDRKIKNKKKNKNLVYVLKHSSKRKKEIIILMIPNGERWYYILIKKLPALLREIISKHNGDHYCLNGLYGLEQKTNLNHM